MAIVLLLAGHAAADPGGSVAGTVSLARLSVGSQVTGYDSVLVYLEDAPAGAAPKASDGPYSVTQIDRSFEPSLLVVPLGATVSFPNADEVFHNVFSTAGGNAFDLGLYKSGASKSVTFTKPGLVPIFCNIHPQMIAYLLVVANPFYARPDDSGRFKLSGIPPGTYHLVAWFPNGNAERREVEIRAGSEAHADLTLRERSGAGRHLDKEGKPYSHY